jgi:hypothetical protein
VNLKKLKYLGMLLGVVIGLALVFSHEYLGYLSLPVPLGLIGFAIGALFE